MAGLAAAFFVVIGMTACAGGPGSPKFLSGPTGEGPDPNISGPRVPTALANEAGITRLIYHVGPVDLPAHMDAAEMLARPLVMRFQLNAPVWVVGFEPAVIDAGGSGLPPALLYQATVANLHEARAGCGSAAQGNPFVLATSQLTKMRLPDGYGYPLLPTDPLEARVVLHNPTGKPYGAVSLQITLLVRPISAYTPLRDVQAMLLDAGGCAAVPGVAPSEFAALSADFSVPADGALVLALGAMQDYGITVGLSKPGDATPFWEAQARHDDEHRIIALDNNPFVDPSGIALRAGSALTVHVSYDNIGDRWLPTAAGGVMSYIAADAQ